MFVCRQLINNTYHFKVAYFIFFFTVHIMYTFASKLPTYRTENWLCLPSLRFIIIQNNVVNSFIHAQANVVVTHSLIKLLYFGFALNLSFVYTGRDLSAGSVAPWQALVEVEAEEWTC